MEEVKLEYSTDELKELVRKDLQSKGYMVKWMFPHTRGISVGVRHLTNLNGDDEVINYGETEPPHPNFPPLEPKWTFKGVSK